MLVKGWPKVTEAGTPVKELSTMEKQAVVADAATGARGQSKAERQAMAVPEEREEESLTTLPRRWVIVWA